MRRERWGVRCRSTGGEKKSIFRLSNETSQWRTDNRREVDRWLWWSLISCSAPVYLLTNYYHLLMWSSIIAHSIMGGETHQLKGQKVSFCLLNPFLHQWSTDIWWEIHQRRQRGQMIHLYALQATLLSLHGYVKAAGDCNNFNNSSLKGSLGNVGSH